MLQRACGSAGTPGTSACAAADETGAGLAFWFELGLGLWVALCVAALWLGLKPGATIGAPRFALGCAGAAGVGFAAFAGATAADGVVAALTSALGATGGGTALSPALVSTMGDIGADSQSSPNSTLPSAIASTTP